MPVILGQVNDDWHQHREGLLLISLKNIEEIVILKETHGSIGNLQVNATNTFYNPLKKTRNQWFDLVYLTNLEYLLQFSQEQGFLNTISEWPVPQQTFQ